MNFKQLEAFIWVAELQSFTRAAKQLYMSQPAISFQIKALEEDLKVILFQRNEKKVTLSEAGKLLYPEAKQMLGHYSKIRAGLDAMRGLKKGRLVIGASTIPGEYLLPHYLGEYRRRYPGVKVSLRVAGSGKVIRWVKEREIDLGVVGIPPQADNLQFIEWLKDELVLIVPPNHRYAGKSIKLLDVINENIIIREEGSGTRKAMLEILTNDGVSTKDINIEMELGSTRAVIGAVQAGIGIGFVSRWAAQDMLDIGKISKATLLGVNMNRSFYLTSYYPEVNNYASEAFTNIIFEISKLESVINSKENIESSSNIWKTY